MSQALEVYLVPAAKDLDVFGCGDRELLNEVLLAGEEALEMLDEQSDVEAESLISHADALREIFAGKTAREDDCGFVYGHAYEVYCAVIGERLSNRYFSPTRVEWLETLDGFFKQHGVGLRFQKLLFEQFPIPVETDASPCGGFWEHQEIAASLPPLKAAIASEPTSEIVAAAKEVLKWLDAAMEMPGSVIVGFFD